MKTMQVLVALGQVDNTYPAPNAATERDSVIAVAPMLVAATIHDNYPSDNASEALSTGQTALNIRSRTGQPFRNAILRRGARSGDLSGDGDPQTAKHANTGRDAAGVVVRQMSPLWKPPSGSPSQPGYRDLFGAFAARAAFTIPVIAALRYKGQLPLDQQPTVRKPNPWDDPTRGSP